MKIVIPVRRARVYAVVTCLLGVVLGLAVSELLARAFWQSAHTDRIELLDADAIHGTKFMDCYPRARGVTFPIDLAEPEGAAEFRKFFPKDVHSDFLRDLDTDHGIKRNAGRWSSESTLALMKTEAPLCLTYDRDDQAPRQLVAPAKYSDTIALLGDSFVFGQGVTEDKTLVTNLARLLDARIRSYAFMGANIKEIKEQFARALAESRHFAFSKIVYFYVLNDPYSSPALSTRLNFLNDLMNVRLLYVRRRSTLLGRIADASALVKALLYEYSRHEVTGEAIKFYRDLNDPVANPDLLRTFDEISKMKSEARARGIDFIVMLYPLMLDMKNYPLAQTHETLGQLAAERGIEFHDLLPGFERMGEGENLTVHPIDYHPNARAVAIAAGAAAAYLKERSPK